jgi:uncharacterized protein (DUF1499 family)
MAFIAHMPLPLRRGDSARMFSRDTTTCAINGMRPVAGTAAAVATAAMLAASVVAPLAADASTFHFAGTRPADLGVRAERYLAASCPPTPNCIGSLENVYDSHYVPSWTYGTAEGSKDARPKKTLDEAVQDLRSVISKYDGATIVTQRETKNEFGNGYYIYAEFESPLMGFGMQRLF